MPPPCAPPLEPRRKIAFVVTEDWFFVSHFLPMARAARDMGLDVVVVTRIRKDAAAIEATGARVVSLEAERRSLNPLAAAASLFRLKAILDAERPDLVHCISLRSILVGGAAARMSGLDRRLYALTGLGLAGARTDFLGRSARATLRMAIRGPLETPRTHYLFENEDDPLLLGLDPASPRVTIVGGAGVDPEAYPPAPMPPSPPLKIAIVARMLWSKGIDVAVEATRRARAAGTDVELSLFGDPDASNPRAIARADLEAWSKEDGIRWHGRIDDVAAVWRDHHAACLPSRGGEGLPRTLLEAAACGRAIVTTDVPGCRSFVRDGIDGFLVAPGDAEALAEAFATLAKDGDGLCRMGAAARGRVLADHTERHVMTALQQLYRHCLGA